MKRPRLWIILPAILLIALLAAVVFRFYRFRARLTPMSVHDRVTKVVQFWGRMPDLPDDKQELEVIWATSGPQFEFYPYGAQDLTEKLHQEFRESGKAVLNFTDIYASANTAGKVKTVDDLATAVRQNYRPQ
jgi:hypothetical protein